MSIDPDTFAAGYDNTPFETAVGRALMNFGALESSLVDAFRDLARMDSSKKASRKVPLFYKMREEYVDLVRKNVTDPIILAELDQLSPDLKALADKRDEITHGVWLDVEGWPPNQKKGKLVWRATVDELLNLPPTVEPTLASQILDLIDEIHQARDRFLRFHAAVISSLTRGSHAQLQHGAHTPLTPQFPTQAVANSVSLSFDVRLDSPSPR